MSESFIEPNSINSLFQPVLAMIDNDGAARFNNAELSSYNFNGLIPTISETASIGTLKAGMSFLPVGASVGNVMTIVKIEFDDPEMIDSPTDNYIIYFIGDLGEIQSEVYNKYDLVQIYKEDWNNKILGDSGWLITQEGNAIFSNVAVRGEVEATTLDVGGSTGITYDGTSVIIGASVVINAPITFNGVTPETLSASLNGYIPDGQAANDINTNITTINGGKITTNSITADKIDVTNLTVRSLLTRTQTNNSRIGIEPSLYFDRINFYSGLISGPGATEVTPPNVRTTYTYNGGVIKPGDQGVTISSGTNTSTTSDAAIEVLASRSTLGRSVNAYADYYNFNSVNSTFYAWNINFSGTISGNGSGLTNIPAPANAVLTTNTYANPSWITSLAGSKITGNISGNANNITAYSINQNLGTGNSVSHTGLNVTVAGGLVGAGVRDNTATNTANVWVTGQAGNGALGRVTASTQKIKKDIEPLSSSFSILDIQTFQFKYKEDYLSSTDNRFNKVVPGFIAEQMYEVLPIAVDLDENKEPENWNVRFIIPIMVKTIQDQQKLIDNLQNRMIELESQIGEINGN